MGELQAAVVGRVWAGTLGMDQVEQVDAEGTLEREWERLQQEEPGETVRKSMNYVLREMEGGGREQGGFMHLLASPRDIWLMERLERLCRLADGSGDGSGEGLIATPWFGDYPIFSPYLKRVRLKLGEIRNKNNSAVAKGKKVMTLAQLGFGEEEVMRDLGLMN